MVIVIYDCVVQVKVAPLGLVLKLVLNFSTTVKELRVLLVILPSSDEMQRYSPINYRFFKIVVKTC